MSTPYRQCRVTYAPFTDDFTARKGEDLVDRGEVAAKLFSQRNVPYIALVTYQDLGIEPIAAT